MEWRNTYHKTHGPWDWTLTSTTGKYSKPAVIFGPLTFFGSADCTPRMRNLKKLPDGGWSFEFQIQQIVGYPKTTHAAYEMVSYAVIESGKFVLPGYGTNAHYTVTAGI